MNKKILRSTVKFAASFFLAAVFTICISQVCVASSGVDSMIVDFTDCLTGPFAKAAAGAGLAIGAGMMYFGNPRGMDVIKWTLAGIVIGVGGGSVIEALFF